MSFLNKVVLITGAGSGIGEAISLHFAKLSARLSLVDKNAEGLKKCAEKCEKISHTKVFQLAVDLTRGQHVQKIVKDTFNEYGRIDVVINCAGIFETGSIFDSEIMDSFDRIMAVNVRSIVQMTNCIAPILIENQGSIVNVSSIAGLHPMADALSYSVSKASICHFTKCVALELAPKGVRINAILPGPVHTNILLPTGMSKEKSDEFWSNYATLTPQKRNVKVDEVAELAAFLASDKAASMTGGNYTIDAGLSLIGLGQGLSKRE